MGYFRHHAIVVTGCADDHLGDAHVEAARIFADTLAEVTPLTEARMNGYRSFLVAPDGSKEGWADSDRAAAAREQFVAYLRERAAVDWIEVNFGGDDGSWVSVRGPYGTGSVTADDAP